MLFAFLMAETVPAIVSGLSMETTGLEPALLFYSNWSDLDLQCPIRGFGRFLSNITVEISNT